jgi:8-amino-7-oxononanoate synthase
MSRPVSSRRPTRLNRTGAEPRRRESDPPFPQSPNGRARRRAGDGWLDRWMDTVSDLARLKHSHPMLDAVIEEIDGRHIRVGDRWLVDFASCNYLGFDLDKQIIDAVPEYLHAWGTHPSWSRLLGSPVIYEEIEAKLTELLGCEDTLLLPTITHIHMSVIPVLVGDGTLFLDGRAHKTIYDGCTYARGLGATVQRFRHNDPEHLEQLLRTCDTPQKVIAMDGVNSMTGNAPELHEFARIAREYDALLYVDDAHGFGVIGERRPDEFSDWGMRGNGVVRHLGETYEDVVMVAGFSKSYSSLIAFLTLPTRLKDTLKVAAPPYLYSGPSPVASLATTLVGLEVNDERGDAIRYDLYRKTRRVMDRLHELDIRTPNRSGYPIIEIPLDDDHDIDEVGRFLFDRGIYVTMAAYPLVPKNEVGFRIQVTAANGDDEIDLLCDVLGELNDRYRLQHDDQREALARGHVAS